jgi:acetylornithine deacetylase/succinyl-diaminopimelate desuccinylase-like protein
MSEFRECFRELDARGHFLKLLGIPLLGKLLLGVVKDERVRVMVQTTITPTVIKGGVKVNVIPDLCELMLDCRILPGVTREGIEKTILNLADSDKIRLEFEVFNEASESPIDTELFQRRQGVDLKPPRTRAVGRDAEDDRASRRVPAMPRSHGSDQRWHSLSMGTIEDFLELFAWLEHYEVVVSCVYRSG